MDDNSIVDLYWQRSEKAISETHKKYGSYCFSIAYNVLANNEDAEESVNDTYLATWNKLPPHRPSILATFLGKITRNISISRWRSRSANKRGGGEIILALDELDECIERRQSLEEIYIRKETVDLFNQFLDTLPKEERNVLERNVFFSTNICVKRHSVLLSQKKNGMSFYADIGAWIP